MPHMLSTEGPALAVADINHDGLEDVFIGSAKKYEKRHFFAAAIRKIHQERHNRFWTTTVPMKMWMHVGQM